MRKILVLTMLLTISTAISVCAQGKILSFEGEHAPVWNISAKDPLVIGGYGDNFAYDGKNVVSYKKGEAKVLVDAVHNTGTMVATFNGTINPEKGKTYTGAIKIVYNVTPTDGPPFWEGGVADFIYLHGDTKQGPPVMPKIRAFLASWAEADVYANGKLIYKGLDGHMMLTERSRDVKTHAIYADSDHSSFYSPTEPSKGSIVASDEKELHFVAHSTTPDENNFPPHSVWIHLNFQNVTDLIDKHMDSLGIAKPIKGVSPPDFTLKTLDGKEVSLSDYRGKIVFLNFWATWCPPCRSEMPSMEKLYQKFKDEDFVMLAVSLRENKEKVENFMRDYKLNFPALLDSTGKVGNTYMVRSIPTTYLISRHGDIIGKAIGARNWASEDSFKLFSALLEK